ncbi:type I restriction-modification system endonuclease [Pedobacter sp. PACM 27299]|uniref:type I restriction-modification system endonuclease n=1 Tax=Pedobacter sp. PACM 27299 TaxID=1727164 RepID=UPI0009E733C0|nr:type I restriction-modification system endonuclease [Pedobacter sp. PACM 27299]
MITSNFNFLEEEFPLLFNLGQSAEYNLHTDPGTALMKLRQFAEHLTELIYEAIGMEFPDDNRFQARIQKLSYEKVLPENVKDFFYNVRVKGNAANHTFVGTFEDAKHALFSSFKLGKWFYEAYSVKNHKIDDVKFHVPDNLDARHALNELEKQHIALQAQFEELKATIKEVPQEKKVLFAKRSEQAAKKLNMSEGETRAVIDEQLRQAGWEANTALINYKTQKTLPQKGKNMAIAEWPCGNLWADYALFIGTELYGLIEAKKYGLDISTNLQQSKVYAAELQELQGTKLLGQWGNFKAPFLFSTNGRTYLKQIETKSGVWFLDTRNSFNNARPLQGWYQPEGLKKLYEADLQEANTKLQSSTLDFLQSSAGLGLRDYQIQAIKAVEDTLVNHPDQKRALLAMATGTGKTRTIIGLCYHLIKNNRFKRILFLVDRSLLANQAADSFKDNRVEDLLTFSDNYEVKHLKDLFPEKDTRLHFATVQGMVKRLFYRDSEKDGLPISVDAYDCIIVDEAHRGYLLDKEIGEEDLEFKDQNDYVSKYRQVLDYFDAFGVGLTATPALHTNEIFGKPVHFYTYREAVIDGFLIDHEPPYIIKTQLGEDGIVWQAGEKPKIYDREENAIKELDELEDELQIEITGFNKRVITESFNRTVVQQLVKELDPDGLEKTLVFAATDEHADLIVKLFKEEFEAIGAIVPDHAIEKITGKSYDPEGQVKRFKNEKYPNIVVTVDLLTTGIDVPTISNLVFLRRVKSRILYEQMLGRATRLCPDIQKQTFKIFDAVGIYEALEDYTQMKPVVVNPTTNFNQLVAEFPLITSTERTQIQIEQIIAKLQRKKSQGNFNADAFSFNADGRDINVLIDELKHNDTHTSVKLIHQLPELWKYLDEFKVAPAHQLYSDHVDTFNEMQRGYGKAKKPEDYLESFSAYLKNNVNEIAALKLICRAPKELSRKELKELLLQLDQQGYNVNTLNAAWSAAKHQDVAADIISYIRTLMIGNTLISKDDRIKNAMQKIRQMKNWNKTQLNWLERIEKQMFAETIVRKEDFDKEPFTEAGGFNRLDKIFENQLGDVLDKMNEYLYENQIA